MARGLFVRVCSGRGGGRAACFNVPKTACPLEVSPVDDHARQQRGDVATDAITSRPVRVVVIGRQHGGDAALASPGGVGPRRRAGIVTADDLVVGAVASFSSSATTPACGARRHRGTSTGCLDRCRHPSQAVVSSTGDFDATPAGLALRR